MPEWAHLYSSGDIHLPRAEGFVKDKLVRNKASRGRPEGRLLDTFLMTKKNTEEIIKWKHLLK